MTGERCTLGVGCDESSTCYSEAMGQPERCPLVKLTTVVRHADGGTIDVDEPEPARKDSKGGEFRRG